MGRRRGPPGSGRNGQRSRYALAVAHGFEGRIEGEGDEVAQILEQGGREAPGLVRGYPAAARLEEGLGAHAARQLDGLGQAMREGGVAAGEEGDEGVDPFEVKAFVGEVALELREGSRIDGRRARR